MKHSFVDDLRFNLRITNHIRETQIYWNLSSSGKFEAEIHGVRLQLYGSNKVCITLVLFWNSWEYSISQSDVHSSRAPAAVMARWFRTRLAIGNKNVSYLLENKDAEKVWDNLEAILKNANDQYDARFGTLENYEAYRGKMRQELFSQLVHGDAHAFKR